LGSSIKLKTKNMKVEILNLIVTFTVSIAYFILAMKIMIVFFEKISRPISHASYVLFLGALIGFGVVFYNISDIASNAFQFYFVKNQVGKGIYYWLIFAIISFVISFLVFHLSFLLVKISTKENEKAELARNNYHIAGIHSIIFILLCFILSTPVANIANTLVYYPKFPN